MKTEIKLTIPKHKIAGLRMGQLIFNAIRNHYTKKTGAYLADDKEVANYLFGVENHELQKIIDEFLEKYKKEF